MESQGQLLPKSLGVYMVEMGGLSQACYMGNYKQNESLQVKSAVFVRIPCKDKMVNLV